MKIKLSLVTCLLSVVASLLVGYAARAPIISLPLVDPAEQYYRGAWDTCVYIGIGVIGIPLLDSQNDCYAFASHIFGAKWYEQPSDGWDFPRVIDEKSGA